MQSTQETQPQLALESVVIQLVNGRRLRVPGLRYRNPTTNPVKFEMQIAAPVYRGKNAAGANKYAGAEFATYGGPELLIGVSRAVRATTPPLCVVPPNAEIVIPEEHVRGVHQVSCVEPGCPDRRIGVHFCDVLKNPTHDFDVLGGFAPQLVRVLQQGEAAPHLNMHPVLAAQGATPPPVDVDDLFTRVARRAGA